VTSELFDPDRLRTLERLRSEGVDPYPARSPSPSPIASARELADNGEAEATVAGRIVAHRPFGKLAFLVLQDRTGRIQVAVRKGEVGERGWTVYERLDLGDLLAAKGKVGRTKTGEVTLFATEVVLLAKALLPPPEKWHGLADVELRTRLRYVDLWASEGVREVFEKRARLVRAIRAFLDGRGYVEVETPTFHAIAGGASARPFTTHHNTLDLDLYLRIALELPLKKLLVGGLERVYEIGRVFRNEGISRKHNPEFTMLESYEAYADYEGIARLVEEMFAAAARAVSGTTEVPFRGKTYAFAPPFRRARYADLLAEHAGVDLFDEGALRARARTAGLPEAGRPAAVVANDLFEALVEERLEGPVFVLDYPAEICPLAKRKPADPRFAERFELFVAGMELANAFTELNDPVLQEEILRAQVASRDEEAPRAVDTDFLRALAYGMPPAGGLGVGIDRLAMLLADVPTIRDVILFPLMRPERG
jgi:lysyl-tRNA synthetase, class II